MECNFAAYLKKLGKKPHVARTLAAQVSQFEGYLNEKSVFSLSDACPEHLDAYASQCEETDPGSARKLMRGLILYYRFSGQGDLSGHAAAIREQGIAQRRQRFPLERFRGVSPETVLLLKNHGISDIDTMLQEGRTADQRAALAAALDVPVREIDELVGLSDLARIRGIKVVRARLYYDAGVDSIEKLAASDPETMRAMLVDFVERTGFDGIPPLPKEARSAVRKARSLQIIIE